MVYTYLVPHERWFLEGSPQLLSISEPSVTQKLISFTGMRAAATGYTGALKHTESHLVRPEQTLSRPLSPKTCYISSTWTFFIIIAASGKKI